MILVDPHRQKVGQYGLNIRQRRRGGGSQEETEHDCRWWPLMRRPVALRWLVVVLVLAAGPAAAQTVLITAAEAAVSSSVPRSTLRSFHLRGAASTGPLVTVVEPKPGQLLHANQPFDLSIAFQPAPGAEIDVDSVELSYVNGRPVDLTPRIGKHINTQGIGITDAVAPAGHHAFRLVVEDSRGRATTTDFTLDIGQ